MKKMIVLMAAAMLAAGVNAAAVGWSCMAGTDWKDGSYSVFVLGMNGVKTDSTAAIDQIKAVVAAGGLSKADSLAFYKGGTVSSTGAANVTTSATGPSITYSGSGTDSYTAIIFVEDAAGENAGYTAAKSISMTNDSTSKTFAFTSQAANLKSNTFSVSSNPPPVIPEPTSGLLVLFGLAGLALRRRRA